MEWARDIFQENSVSTRDLIQPIFVIPGANTEEPAPGLTGVNRYTPDLAAKRAKEVWDVGIRSAMVLPCPHPEMKTLDAKEAINTTGFLAEAVAEMKEAAPELGLIGDIALDVYTTHGHDGLMNSKTGVIENDATIARLAEQSIAQAQMGFDALAPSDMMDGRVSAIRAALEHADFQDVMIFPHSAKYASALYGPYRGAVGSDTSLGKRDKRTYQQNPANAKEALREVALDIQEGADAIICKPGIFYLDVIHQITDKFKIPVIAFDVSGEYAMMMSAAEQGLIDHDAVLLEKMVSFKRAGASAVVSYSASHVAELLT